jgi:hypothetical protein
MNAANTGIAVTGAVGYGILDPTSSAFMALAVGILILLYLFGKTSATRHLRKTEAVDKAKADLVFSRWLAKQQERAGKGDK